MNTEPTRLIGYVTSAVGAIIALAIAFGANITDAQRNAIITVIVATAPVIVFIVEYTRSKVTPSSTAISKDTAQAVVNQAAANPPGAPVPTLK